MSETWHGLRCIVWPRCWLWPDKVIWWWEKERGRKGCILVLWKGTGWQRRTKGGIKKDKATISIPNYSDVADTIKEDGFLLSELVFPSYPRLAPT